MEEPLLDLLLKCNLAHGRDLYPMDLLANAGGKRAVALLAGFCRMIEDRNLICAGPLLRLQLDTALRFYAAWLVEKPHEFAAKVLGGTRVDKLKDRDGNRLRDSYLVEKLSREDGCQWIPRVYEETSGYVHFSDKHMFSVLSDVDRKTRSLSMTVSAVDCDWPESVYLEAVDAFIAATGLFMKYLHGWGFTKQNPDQVARLRKERGESQADRPPNL
jgi:hypothetical protein